MNGTEADRYAAGGYVRPVAVRLGWTELDHLAVESARVLAADAVQRAGTGHPGTAMSLAPVAYLLFQEVMRHNPGDDQWLGRDRFVLSCGHSSLTLYLQLYLAGYGLEMADLKKLRTWGSAAPGHPEHRQTAGVEITTGPLGHGVGSAVGMAMAARRERGLLDPEPAHGQSVFDHHVYVLASDGDLMEGLSAESATLAGNQQLGNLVLIYDQNRVGSEDDTDIAFTEDVGAPVLRLRLARATSRLVRDRRLRRGRRRSLRRDRGRQGRRRPPLDHRAEDGDRLARTDSVQR